MPVSRGVTWGRPLTQEEINDVNAVLGVPHGILVVFKEPSDKKDTSWAATCCRHPSGSSRTRLRARRLVSLRQLSEPLLSLRLRVTREEFYFVLTNKLTHIALRGGEEFV